MDQNLGDFILERECIDISDGILVALALIGYTKKCHEAGEYIFSLFPENIGICEKKGGFCLEVNIRGISSRQVLQHELDEAEWEAFVPFRPPEIAVMDHDRIGRQTDYYSITAIFYYCLTGKRRSLLEMLRSDISGIGEIIRRNHMDEDAGRLLYRILKKGLAHSRRNRYQTLEELKQDITTLKAHIEI